MDLTNNPEEPPHTANAVDHLHPPLLCTDRSYSDSVRDPDDTLQAQSSELRPLAMSFSEVTALNSPKTVTRRTPDLPGSPGGWGALDHTRAEESDSESDEEELSTPQMLYVWHSPTPVRQILTGQRPMCTPPTPHTSPPQHPPPASLQHVIQYLHDRAAQSTSQSPCYATPRKKRQYGGAYCLEQTSAGTIRHELTSKRQLARRGGYWDVVGDEYYIDSDQSDSDVEDYETDEELD